MIPPGLIARPVSRAVVELNGKAVVLRFTSADIEWRHENMVEAGASYDFPEYKPHVTISYGGAPADLTRVEPYQGKLVFGPEIFEPIDDDWKESIRETSFAEGSNGDAIDRIAADLLAANDQRPLSPQLTAILAALAESDDRAALDQALLEALDPGEAAAFTQALARAAFAVRLDAETTNA